MGASHRSKLPAWLRSRDRRSRLLDELRRRQKQRVHPIHAKALPHWFRTALIEEFGSVNAARTLLGLPVFRESAIASKKIIPEIKHRHAKSLSLAYSHVPRPLLTAALARFGSWRGAIEAAGLDYSKLGLKVKRYSDGELIEWLRGLADAKPRLKLNDLMKERHFGATVVRFGSWQNAVKRAGLTDWPARQKRAWTKAAVVAEMRALARSGKSISADPNLYQAAKRHFVSFQEAAAAAGVSARAPRKWSRTDVVAKLREIARTHGTVTNALATAAGVGSAAHTIFGSLTAACDAAGVVGYRRKLADRHVREENARGLLAELRAIARPLNRPVTRRDLKWSFHQALLRQFESLDAARDAAGLPQPKPLTRWSRARALDELRREHRRGTRITHDGLVDAGRGDLLSAIPVYVGTITGARRLARIPAPKRLPFTHIPFLKKWDEDTVIDGIQERVAAGQALAPSLVPRPLTAVVTGGAGVSPWRSPVTTTRRSFSGATGPMRSYSS